MARGNKDHHTKRWKNAFLKCFSKTLNISKSARAIKVDRSWVHRCMQNDPEFAQAVEDIREAFLDSVEEKHFKEAIKGRGKGSTVSRIHILNSKGRERGWTDSKQDNSGISITIERVVIASDTKQPIQIQHNDVKGITHEQNEEN